MADMETLRQWGKHVQTAAAVVFMLLLLGANRMFTAGNVELGSLLLLVGLALGTVVLGSGSLQKLRDGEYGDGVGFGLTSLGVAAAAAHVRIAGPVAALTPLTAAAAVGIVVGMLVAVWGETTDSWVATPWDL